MRHTNGFIGLVAASAIMLAVASASPVYAQQSGGSVGGGSSAASPATSQSGGSVGASPQSGGSVGSSGTGSVGAPQSGGSVGGGESTFYLQNPLKTQYSTVGGLVSGFIDILAYLAVLAAVIMLIWTGLQFVLAQGDTKKLSELKDRLLKIVIGLALVIGARIIVAVVINTLEATNVVSTTTIQSAKNALNGQ